MKRILRLPEVIEVTGIGKTTIYEKIAAGEFPRPVKLTSQAVGWREADLEKWMEGLETAEAA